MKLRNTILGLALGFLVMAGVAGAANYRDYFSVGALLVTNQTITGADTLTVLDAGQTIFVGGGSGGTITLPTNQAGMQFKFVISAAYDTANIVIASAEGDNISGTAVVAYATVACAAEDQLNFVADGETVGDFVEITADGTNWIITDSNVTTSAKLTCTDPA